MRYLVCWFLAAPEDAAAIRSTAATKLRQREEWPHLVVPGVDGPDMNTLEKLVRPKRPKGSSRIGGQLLDKSKLTATPFTAVSRIAPEFLEALAALDEAAIQELGRKFAGAVDGVSADEAVALVGRLAEFARRAVDAGQCVLELDVM